VIIDEMKLQYEEKTGNFLTGNNLYNFGIFVHKKYDEYQIIDVMKDAKIKYNLGMLVSSQPYNVYKYAINTPYNSTL
jgi:hypothetical protein